MYLVELMRMRFLEGSTHDSLQESNSPSQAKLAEQDLSEPLALN